MCTHFLYECAMMFVIVLYVGVFTRKDGFTGVLPSVQIFVHIDVLLYL